MPWPLRRFSLNFSLQRTDLGHNIAFPESAPDTFLRNVLEGYDKNELVFACIDMLSSSLPEAPLTATRNSMPIEPVGHPLLRPNRFMDQNTLFQMVELHLELAGNAYWEKVRDATGRVVELWPIRPDRVRVVPDARQFIAHYTIRFGTQDFPIAVEDIVHFKLPHPTDPYFGQAPLKSIARQVAQDNTATDFSWALLKNSALPGVVIETMTKIDEVQAKRHRANWRRHLTGRGAGGIAFMQKGLKVIPISLNMQELGFKDLRDVSETRICMAFKVSPIVIGARIGLEQSALRNYDSAMKSLWEQAIAPRQRTLISVINHDPDMTAGEILWHFDTSEVAALEGRRTAQTDHAAKQFQAGLVMRDEARKVMDMPPVGGDLGNEFAHPLAWAARLPNGDFLTPDTTTTQPGDTPPRDDETTQEDRSDAAPDP